MNYLPIILISILLFSVILAILYLIGRELLNKLSKEKIQKKIEELEQIHIQEINRFRNDLLIVTHGVEATFDGMGYTFKPIIDKKDLELKVKTINSKLEYWMVLHESPSRFFELDKQILLENTRMLQHKSYGPDEYFAWDSPEDKPMDKPKDNPNGNFLFNHD